MWTKTDLVAVDPAPDSEDPYCVDGSLVTDEDDNVLREKPDGVCCWCSPKESA